jgi:DNA-binding transcriptional LysR family regulator
MRTIDFLRRVPIFHSVVENQSFSRAAKELGLTKSAVSANVKQLEEELAVRLLNRSTRTVSLTEAGEELFITSGRIVELVADATGRLGALSEQPIGRVRIGTSVGFGTLHLMPLLADFHDLFPEVEYEVVLEDQRVDPVKEKMDLLIRFGPQRESGYVTRKLGRMGSVTCAAPKYLEGRKPARRPADLAMYEWLLFDGDRSARLTFERRGRCERVRVSGRFRTNSLLALHEALRRGMGVATVARLDVAEDLESGRLVEILDEWTLPSLDVVALYPVGHLDLPKVRLLVDFLSERWRPLD